MLTNLCRRRSSAGVRSRMSHDATETRRVPRPNTSYLRVRRSRPRYYHPVEYSPLHLAVYFHSNWYGRIVRGRGHKISISRPRRRGAARRGAAWRGARENSSLVSIVRNSAKKLRDLSATSGPRCIITCVKRIDRFRLLAENNCLLFWKHFHKEETFAN